MNDDMQADVLFEKRGRLGLITLNRPRALNALDRGMCVAIGRQLGVWDEDEDIGVVAIAGAGDRAFCAGGDVVGVHDAGRAGPEEWEGFFHDEYRMNHAIANYRKVFVALIDGIVMGGGVGVSIHAPYRVVTPKVMFAMPETAIGLIPDVGGTYALPRLPGQIGAWLGLTGARLGAADCVYAGIATHVAESERLGELTDRLAAGGAIEEVLAAFAVTPEPGQLEGLRDGIDFHFAHDHVEAIIESLGTGDDWARQARATLARMSPTSLKLTLRALRAGASLDIGEALRQEYRVVCHIRTGHDFYEGVRAQLIDKDRDPKWSPATLAEVEESSLDPYFEAPPGGDLLFPLPPEMVMAMIQAQHHPATF